MLEEAGWAADRQEGEATALSPDRRTRVALSYGARFGHWRLERPSTNGWVEVGRSRDLDALRDYLDDGTVPDQEHPDDPDELRALAREAAELGPRVAALAARATALSRPAQMVGWPQPITSLQWWGRELAEWGKQLGEYANWVDPH